MSANGGFRKLLFPPDAPLRRAIRALDAHGGIVLVADTQGRLLGVLVDADVRKAMLKGHNLRTPLKKVMNPRPVTLPFGSSPDELARFFSRTLRANVPLVDGDGVVRGLARLSDHLKSEPHDNWVVLLVGGRGRRLYPLTQDRPKPLLTVGDKPLLETIVSQFIGAGFKNFLLAVNHHAAQIRAHFGDGRRFGARVEYLHETRPLGTAGALSLIRKPPELPLIVMNGDLLTKVDFTALLDFHRAEKNLATVCVREYELQVPFGVVELDAHRLQSIEEKPTKRYFVNAGIYVLDPLVLRLVPKNKRFDMPALLQKVSRRRRGSVGCFPIREYWIDIGRLPDYERAQLEFGKFFIP